MAGLILRRLVSAFFTLLLISILVFAATEILPGDLAEAILGRDATPELVAALREKLGLSRPVPERYFDWLAGVFSGDLGRSLATNATVSSVVEPRLWNSIGLAGYSALVAIPLALILGLLSAAFPNSWLDRVVSSTSVFLVSIPDFVIALCLIAVLAVHFRLFPAIIYRPDWSDPIKASHQMFLPMLTLVIAILAHITRMLRAALLDVLASGFIEMALLKGASKPRILFRHALPNAIGPTLSVVALALGYLFSGVVIVEVVFSYPGLGRLLVDAVLLRDIPVIQITTSIFCAVYIVFNAAADFSLLALSPRVRHAT